MRRREFILGLSAAVSFGRPATWAVGARAQTVERKRRLGVLMSYTAADPEARRRFAALEPRLRELGWPDGKLDIAYRWAGGADPKVLQTDAGELVATAPDVLLVQSTPLLAALRRVSSAI